MVYKRYSDTRFQKFYDSKKWKTVRNAYIADHPYCERCMSAGKVVPAQNVHHIRHLTADTVSNPLIALAFDNLESLCHDCHYSEHFGKTETQENLFFDSDGNLVRRSPPGE